MSEYDPGTEDHGSYDEPQYDDHSGHDDPNVIVAQYTDGSQIGAVKLD